MTLALLRRLRCIRDYSLHACADILSLSLSTRGIPGQRRGAFHAPRSADKGLTREARPAGA